MPDIYARVRSIVGSTADWAANNIVLGSGEIGIERVSASDVRLKVGDGTTAWASLPYASASSTTINLATQAALDAKLALAGGTMTGLLVLSGNPSAALGAVTKQYADNISSTLTTSINGKMSASGGTMTGYLSLHADPTSAMHSATKQYVDAGDSAKISKAGDAMSGALVLAADPANAMEAATKQYVDNGSYQSVVGGSAAYAGKVVKLNSSGLLDTSIVPVSAAYLGTVNITLAYALSGTFTVGSYYSVSASGTVDSSWNSKINGSPSTCGAGQLLIYNANGKWDLVGDTTSSAAISGKLDKAGGTMTGTLVLAADPASALHAATKQYADTKLPLAGGTLTGALILSANPSTALGAATKQYVDNADSALTSAYTAADTALSASLTMSISGKLSLSGGTMTGALTLAADPSSALHAATKQYVDSVTTGAALRSNNLSDLANAVTARSNIAAAGTGVANTFSQPQTFSGGIASSFVVKATGGNEGGEFHLERPSSNSTLAGNVAFDSCLDLVRIFENGGTYRGAYIDLSKCATGVGSSVVTSSDPTPLPPAGALMPYAGAAEPSGWLFCNGREVSRSTYANLFSAIGTIYGAGNGSTTFNLPDLRGRIPVGHDSMGGVGPASRVTSTVSPDGQTLGAVGGNETHQLSPAQMPSHQHLVFTNTRLTDINGLNISSTNYAVRENDDASSSLNYRTKASATPASVGLTSAAGSSLAHNNVQPSIILNYIIKA